MPKRKCALKRLRVDKKNHLRNVKTKQLLKKTIKKFHALISSKNLEEARKTLKNIYSQFDKAAKKKIIHSGTADRKKSRLTRKIAKTA